MNGRARSVATVAGVAVGTALGLGSCGVQTSNEVEVIEPELLAGLDPTTTTTTTEPAPTTPPGTPATQPAGTTTTSEQPVTTLEPDLYELYFLDGERLVAVDLPLPADTSVRRQLEALGEGPPAEEADAGVRTAVPLGLVRSVRLRGPVVTVDLDGEMYATIDADDQRYMIGQMVLTLTRADPRVEVRFTLDEAPLRVFRRDGTVSEPGEAVGRADYAQLLDDEATGGAGGAD